MENVFSETKNASFDAVKFNHALEVILYCGAKLDDAHLAAVETGEDPGIGHRRASNHDSITASMFLDEADILNCAHIPISDDWNGNRLFYFGDGIPIRISSISLVSGSPVNRDQSPTVVFDDPRNLKIIAGGAVPAQADFGCDRDWQALNQI